MSKLKQYRSIRSRTGQFSRTDDEVLTDAVVEVVVKDLFTQVPVKKGEKVSKVGTQLTRDELTRRLRAKLATRRAVKKTKKPQGTPKKTNTK